MPRFAVNCSILFTEAPLLERFARAKAAGFDAVECWWPAGVDLEDFARAIEDAGVQLILLNLDAGDMPAGDRGLLNDPDAEERIRANLETTLTLARRLGCARLNALAGNERDGEPREAQIARVCERLRWMAPRAAAAGVTLLLEAINLYDSPRYLFHRTPEILAALDEIGAPNVKYQYDLYHLQRGEGSLTQTLRERIDRIGHIQIADVPDRNEPGTGEINYRHMLQVIDDLGYDGYVSLEYKARAATEDSFAWLPPDRRGQVAVERLNL